jgi:acyl-CoA thioesterase
MTALTPLSTLLATRVVDSNCVQFTIPEDWQQGRTTFGGLIAVLAVQAMRDIAGRSWPAGVHLRALQTSFIGPVGKGLVQVTVQLLREGKHVRQVQAMVRQGTDVAATLLGVFGAERDTVLPTFLPEQPATPHGPDTALQLPFVPGISPNFIQHMDVRWAEGGLPFSGAESWHSRIHLRLRDDSVDRVLLAVLLADAAPSPVISRYRQPTPASSVSWELELRPSPHTPDPAGHWRIDTEVMASGGGYVNQVSRLWSPSGELAALGYQVVAAFG